MLLLRISSLANFSSLVAEIILHISYKNASFFVWIFYPYLDLNFPVFLGLYIKIKLYFLSDFSFFVLRIIWRRNNFTKKNLTQEREGSDKQLIDSNSGNNESITNTTLRIDIFEKWGKKTTRICTSWQRKRQTKISALPISVQIFG